jgi:hypothetical protein
MGSIPAFLLERLYAKGSLRNTAAGFELTIQNTLAPGTIVGLEPLQVDGEEYALERTKAVLPDGTQLSSSDLSAESPMRFAVGDRVTIQVDGFSLSPGLHKLVISPKTKEAGVLHIRAADNVD